MSTTPLITVIAAISKNHGLGKDNQLLWKISQDLQFFKKTTSGNPIIMGSKTYFSIGRPLPNRLNIVVSPTLCAQNASIEGCTLAPSIPAAIAIARSHLEQRHATPEYTPEIFIIGGAQIYTQVLMDQLATRLLLTQIDAHADADAFFPAIDSEQWREVWRESHFDEVNQLNFSFVDYRKVTPK